jgi:GR25 family glycosyltransferase involved in LPS biosynthesis
MKKYYINLNRAPDRRLKMENMYSNLIRIEAYDGKCLNKYTDIVIPTNTYATAYELGCSFSHIKAIITAYLNGDDGAIIMEDDIYMIHLNQNGKKI